MLTIRKIALDTAEELVRLTPRHYANVVQAAIHAGIKAWAQQEPSVEMVDSGIAVDWPYGDIYGDLDANDCKTAAKDIYRAMLNQAIKELEED